VSYTRPEPLRGKHRLNGFDCGEESLSAWLLRYARQAEATGSARVFVATEDGQVVGYYALAAGQVEPATTTPRLRKGQPKRRPIPVVILARLAVDNVHQGRGLGRSLLQDALLRCAAAAREVGVRACVVHALPEARAFYEAFGFEPSPTDSLHLTLLMKDLQRFLAEEG
jgi:predicted N-acetyltransferase YhbS